MSLHAPKLFALEALVAARLSERGRARLERHLAGCETCREALGVVREYSGLRDAARDVPMPELSWERFERALEQDQAAQARTARGNRAGKLLALSLPLLAIAATVVIGWVGISGQREAKELAAQTQRAAPPTEEVEANDLAIKGFITLGTKAAQTANTNVLEGVTLRTGPGEELHVQLAVDTGIVLLEESELVVSRLRAHSVRLKLVRGGVSSSVRKLASEDSYVVEVDVFTAEVRGTRFFVHLRERNVRVDVHEGLVAVLQQGKQIDLLSAGKSFSSSATNVGPAPDRAVVGLDEDARDWPTLTLPPLPPVTAWHVGGGRLLARAELAMRAPPGEVALSFEDARGKLHPLTVVLAAEGGRIEEADVRAVLQEEADARMGTLLPEQITPVIQSALPGLRRCYERGLRRGQVEGRLTLSVRVAADGHVARAQLQGESALPQNLTDCIAQQARGWVFPEPDGGPVAFEIPLNLKTASAP